MKISNLTPALDVDFSVSSLHELHTFYCYNGHNYSFDDWISYIVVGEFQTYFIFIISLITSFLFSLIIFYPFYTLILGYIYFHFLRKSRF